MTDDTCTCGQREAEGYSDALHGECPIHYKLRKYAICDHSWVEASEGIVCIKCDKYIFDINLGNKYEV